MRSIAGTNLEGLAAILLTYSVLHKTTVPHKGTVVCYNFRSINNLLREEDQLAVISEQLG